MKQGYFLIFIFLISSNIQSQSIAGTYERNITDTFICTLIINTDNSFNFHYYQKFEAPNPEKNIYGKGRWTLENNILTLFTKKPLDIDERYTLDFSNSKARYISKSSRDKTEREVKTALRFFQSEIPWVQGMQLQKTD